MAASGETNRVLGVGEGWSGQVGNGAGNTQLEAVLGEGEANVGGGQGGETLQTGLHVEGGCDSAHGS